MSKYGEALSRKRLTHRPEPPGKDVAQHDRVDTGRARDPRECHHQRATPTGSDRPVEVTAGASAMVPRSGEQTHRSAVPRSRAVGRLLRERIDPRFREPVSDQIARAGGASSPKHERCERRSPCTSTRPGTPVAAGFHRTSHRGVPQTLGVPVVPERTAGSGADRRSPVSRRGTQCRRWSAPTHRRRRVRDGGRSRFVGGTGSGGHR